MRIFKKGILAAAVACFFLWGTNGLAAGDAGSEPAGKNFTVLAPTKVQAEIDGEIVYLLKHRHYLKISFDDQLSQKVLNRYLDMLDKIA